MIVLLVVVVVAAIAVVVVSAVVAGVSRDVVVVWAVVVGCQLATRPRLGTACRNTAGRPLPRPWHRIDINTHLHRCNKRTLSPTERSVNFWHGG